MILTSTFYSKGLAGKNLVSVARSNPRWFKGADCKLLAPSWPLLDDYKSKRINWDEYVTRYTRDVLDRLDVNKVGLQLDGWILLCWESPDDPHCHRHIIAQWLTRAGYPAEEYTPDQTRAPKVVV